MRVMLFVELKREWSKWKGSDGMAHPHAFLDWELRISVV